MKAAYANHSVVGDPDRAAEAIVAALSLDDPPFRLPLHEMSVESTRAKLKAVEQNLDQVEELSRAVHYVA